ncbi:hypothetical protein AB205_0202030 [Aquarana catesbeiana]|uniref:Uncharacterized protein n=1 Tax=Aquarana catesbeiana TaxID=8400 RepID=A0A2G9RUH2_AQUCT|nr:hypothetical protein AB205_0202030 [Aquarana catesbeiana]
MEEVLLYQHVKFEQPMLINLQLCQILHYFWYSLCSLVVAVLLAVYRLFNSKVLF